MNLNSMDTSDHTPNQLAPQVYRKLVDYTSSKARPTRKLIDYSAHRASHSYGTALPVDRSPISSPKTKMPKRKLSSSSKKPNRMSLEEHFLSKESSSMYFTGMDSSATFGRVRSTSVASSTFAPSRVFALKPSCSAEDSETTAGLTTSMSLSEHLCSSRALPNHPEHTFNCSTRRFSTNTPSVAESEEDDDKADERRIKMNWLANNTAKRNLMEKKDTSIPLSLKVIYQHKTSNTEASVASSITGTDSKNSNCNNCSCARRLSSATSTDETPTTTATSTSTTAPKLPSRSRSERRSSRRNSPPNMDASVVRSLAGQGPKMQSFTRRRSTNSFIAGSQIRVYNRTLVSACLNPPQ